MLVFIIGPRFTMGKIETRLYGRASVARLEVGLAGTELEMGCKYFKDTSASVLLLTESVKVMLYVARS